MWIEMGRRADDETKTQDAGEAKTQTADEQTLQAQRAGIDIRGVPDEQELALERELSVERKRKSLSTERTFPKDLMDINLCLEKLDPLIIDLRERLLKLSPAPSIKALTMKIKFSDFTQTTVSRQAQEIDSSIFHELLKKGVTRKNTPIRLLGVGVELREALSKTTDDRQESLNL